MGAAGLRRGASVGARRRRGLRAGRRRRRRGPVLRLPARVRRHGHRRHRVDLRVHQRAAGVRRRGHRQPPLRADPRLLRRHRHPDIRVSLVQGRADGEQGCRGARPQRRLPLIRSRGRATNVMNIIRCYVPLSIEQMDFASVKKDKSK